MAGLRNRSLVERDREQRIIDEAVDEVSGGKSRLLVVEGPPGVGKTRLVLCARERARAAGFQDLATRANELERSFAFGVVRGLFQPRLAELMESERSGLFSGQARMAARPLGVDVESFRSAGGDALQAVFYGLFWLSVGLAQEQPLLFAVDDAHWSDEASLRWLAFAAPRFEGIPILMVLACRSSEPGAEGSNLVLELARGESADVLAPPPLSRTAVEDLISQMLEGTSAPAFAEACFEATKGNPFLLHELLREMEAAHVDPTSACSADRVVGLGSRRVSESVLGRVQKLGGDAVRLTRALAVLGDRIRLSDAAALAELDEESAMKAAAGLVDADVLVEGFPLEFAHPLVRSAIYEHLPYVERLAAHERAARILAGAGARPEAIAAHLLIARPNGDSWVVGVLRRAAAEASAQGSPGDAASHLWRALAEPPTDALRGAVLAELGVAEHNAGDAKAVGHLSEALERTAEARERARIGLVLARAIWTGGGIADAVALLDSLASELDAELAAPLRAELIAIARLAPQTRQVGLRVLEGEVQRAPHGQADGLLLANLAFERAVAGEMPADDVAELAERALGDGALLSAVGSENTIYHLAAWALAQCDRFAEAEVALRAAVELARTEGSAVGFARALTFRANLCYRRGLLAEAEADANQALEQLTPARAPLAAAFLLDVLIDRDELRAADDLLERLGLAGDLPDSILHTILLERRGRLRMAQGKSDQALVDLMTCRRRALKWGAGSPAFLAWRSSAARALDQAGRTRDAMALAAEEVQRAKAFGSSRALGIALRVQGLLAHADGGVELLAQAESVMRGSGAELEHGRALVDLGTAVLRAGQRSRARGHLRAGLELAERHAARALAQQARTELRSAGGRPGREGRAGVDALTPAELRVAMMAAEGMSNRDIAEALFVIPKTVEWHLGQTYRKLGTSVRTELRELLPQNGHKTNGSTGDGST